jgi:hypothetical protein
MKRMFCGPTVIVLASLASAQQPPIIDAHLHAGPASSAGTMCAHPVELPSEFPPKSDGSGCAQPLRPASTDAELLNQTLAMLGKWNITAITSGPPAHVHRWKEAGQERIIPALGFRLTNAPPVGIVRDWFASGRFAVLGEVSNQYAGIAPDDPSFEPYLAMAEELDIPVAYHMTAALPNAPYTGLRKYRARLGDPFLFEEVLVRHPKLRLYVMHLAHPLSDSMIAMMISHPQLYVDTGAIAWALPRDEFYRHLRRFVEAGLTRRIMFGSDQMQWPDAIRVAIKSIESAPFLTPEQKRDILFHNANRFFRLRLPEAHDVRRKDP